MRSCPTFVLSDGEIYPLTLPSRYKTISELTGEHFSMASEKELAYESSCENAAKIPRELPLIIL
jgi:hypothetical protein